MKLYYMVSDSGPPLLLSFLDSLDSKSRMKLIRLFQILLNSPLPCEPLVKHFNIERYSALYELRARSKVMIRVIFTIREDGGILLLKPFVKKQPRNTAQALEASLRMLAQIETGTCSVREMLIHDLLEESE